MKVSEVIGGYPKIIQVIRPWRSIETYGELGVAHFREPPYMLIFMFIRLHR